ncbi:ependymin-related protein 1-like [Ptychodera flava]|uniref:ependymin-related protein 1-like n=1 Tax=Ptychodera flava TaxID=63121 RepID=UPI00396A1E3B
MKVLLILSVALCSAVAYKCCPPKTWEGVMGQLGGYMDSSGETGPISEAALVHYDHDRSRQVTQQSVYEAGKKTDYRLIKDYIANEQYLVANEESCSTSHLPGTYDDLHCIPADATDIGVAVFGMDGLQTNVYYFEMTYGDTAIKEYVTVTSDECVPVAVQYISSGPFNSQFRSIGFYNLTTEFRDPGVFDIPAVCYEAQSMSADDMTDSGAELLDWVMRRHRR